VVGSLPTGDVEGIAAADGWVYLVELDYTLDTLAVWDLTLRIVDASNPSSPVERARVALDRLEVARPGFRVGFTFPVRVAGDIAYAATFRGARAIDVSDPARPVDLGAFPSGLPADLRNGGLVGVSELGGVTATDVSAPGAPRVLGGYLPPGQVWDAAISRGLVFVASSAGLRIVDLGPEYGLILPAAIELQRGPRPGARAGRGLLRLALLGSPKLDVSQVDPATLALGPGGVAPLEHPPIRHRDVNRDGFTDLLLAFRTDAVDASREDTRVCLSGETSERTYFEACAPLGEPPHPAFSPGRRSPRARRRAGRRGGSCGWQGGPATSRAPR